MRRGRAHRVIHLRHVPIPVGEETQTATLDLFAMLAAEHPREWKGYLLDGLHFNPAGNRVVFEAVQEALQRHHPHLLHGALGEPLVNKKRGKGDPGGVGQQGAGPRSPARAGQLGEPASCGLILQISWENQPPAALYYKSNA
eukprot:7435233-Pyramimonas_sp.AAC.2